MVPYFELYIQIHIDAQELFSFLSPLPYTPYSTLHTPHSTLCIVCLYESTFATYYTSTTEYMMIRSTIEPKQLSSQTSEGRCIVTH